MACHIHSGFSGSVFHEGSNSPQGKFTAVKLKERSDVKPGDWIEIARGKAKRVFMQVQRSPEQENLLQIDRSRVIYLACAGKEEELLSEVETAQRIEVAIGNFLEETNIATNLRIVPNDQCVMIETQAAIADLDNYIQQSLNKDSPYTEVMDLGAQLIHGMGQLHRAGYMTGDLKLENALVFREEGRLVVRISDFGKTTQAAKEPLFYSGNPRYAAPENVLTFKAEVYGVGLMLVRLLEEACVDKAFVEGVASLPKRKSGILDTSKGLVGRRGVEGVAVAHGAHGGKGILCALDKVSAFAKARTRVRSIASVARRRNAVIQEYVEKILAPHAKKVWSSVDPNLIDQLIRLILEMLYLTPGERPDMESVECRFRNILALMTSSAPSLERISLKNRCLSTDSSQSVSSRSTGSEPNTDERTSISSDDSPATARSRKTFGKASIMAHYAMQCYRTLEEFGFVSNIDDNSYIALD